MKINIPHIHKIEGEAGFWAKVAKDGKIEELKLQTLEGLRQIEGILIGRKVQEVPLVVSRICGICPVVHILNAICALEKSLEIKVSDFVVLLRKLLLANQIIQSHCLHLFFMSLPDFFQIDNDLALMKKFPKEAKAVLKIRDYSLKAITKIAGRAVHPITPRLAGFSKLPPKEDLRELLKEIPAVLESSLFLADTFRKLNYPAFERKTIFTSLFSKKEYAFYEGSYLEIKKEMITAGDFYSNKIEEDLKNPPVKKVKFKSQTYMVGPIARIDNNFDKLNPRAQLLFREFIKEKKISFDRFFTNIFHNLFCQAVEIVHFLEESKGLIEKILENYLSEGPKEFTISRGSGLSAMEAPRGTLFTYLEVDDSGRISHCNIITPTTQFLNNIEEDLKKFVPDLRKLKKEEKIRKIRFLIRAYDPCISCATH